ncbi:MAG TPA: hypothetical protein VFX56_06570 [Nitrospira sp.]|nr:hypothetical protein [Nitrospira sp.]
MNTTLHSKRVFCAVLLLFAVSWGAVSGQAADSPPAMRASGTDTTITTIEPRIAAGAVEDTLKACMARIPKDASIGQRMVAEQSCGRDESDRKPFLAVPGAWSIRHEQRSGLWREPEPWC